MVIWTDINLLVILVCLLLLALDWQLLRIQHILAVFSHHQIVLVQLSLSTLSEMEKYFKIFENPVKIIPAKKRLKHIIFTWLVQYHFT